MEILTNMQICKLGSINFRAHDEKPDSKAINLSGKSKIVLTGGVALNCKMIHSLSKQDIFEELSGSAIGAANFAFLEKSKTKTLDFSSIFLGPKKILLTRKKVKIIKN